MYQTTVLGFSAAQEHFHYEQGTDNRPVIYDILEAERINMTTDNNLSASAHCCVLLQTSTGVW